jgi:hypothetical protein
MTKQKHYELIIAWANGESIELYNPKEDIWHYVPSPSWFDSLAYRVRPTPRPDVVRGVTIVLSSFAGPLMYAASPLECNCVLLFDGETNTLKDCTFKPAQ